MHNTMNKEGRFGPLTQDISNAIHVILEKAYQNAETTVNVEYEIPEGFVRVPEETLATNSKGEVKSDMGEGIKTALSAALPACLTALAMAFNAPSVAVVLLSGAGGVAGSFIQNTWDGGTSQPELKNVDLERLTEKDLCVKVKVNEERRKQFMADSTAEADRLCQEISAYEKRMSSRYDVSVDRAFGEWIQSFLLYADKNPEDRKLQRLKDMLMDRLAIMGVHVYDEVLLNQEGCPDVPYPDYLIDRSAGGSYEAVDKPAVYTDRALLARGEIH